MLSRIGLALGFAAVASPAMALEWFQHEFGELRAFSGDWLAVCDEKGAGPCRVVATGVDPGSQAFFDLRLAVHRLDNSPDWAIEVMDRGLPAAALTGLSFDFGGDVVTVTPQAWTQGDIGNPGASDTVTIRDADVAFALVEKMKPGNRVTVRYEPQGDGNGEASFSLRGVTTAMNAIEARVLARQE